MAANSQLLRKEIPLTGKLVTSEDPVVIGANFRELKNMRYTRTNPKGIGGHTKINSTALTYPKVRSGIHFRKEQPAESHVLVEAWNSAKNAREIYANTNAVPGTGDFGSSIYTPSTAGENGRWSLAPNGYVAYANGQESCLWGGNEAPVGGFINYDPAGTFFKDQTLQVSDTSAATTGNVAYLERVTESTADDVLLLHLENNVTDAIGTHTPVNNNVTFTTGKFGSYSAVFNGTNAYINVPDHADFDFNGASATWTIDCWVYLDDFNNNHPIYDHATDGNNYFKILIDTNGAIIVSNYSGGTEQLNSGSGFSTSNSVITAGGYNHVEVVRNGSDWYIFVNGTLKQTLSDSTDCGTESGSIRIGYDGTNYFDGRMDEYRVSSIARHTTDFEVPIAAYGDRTVTYFYVGSILPLEGFKLYINSGNTTSASMSVDYWDGDEWSAASSLVDGTLNGAASLGQTGTVEFSSTASTAKVKQIKGVVLYWYRVSVPSADNNVNVYHVTVKTPFQPIKDIWDGTTRQIGSFYKYSSGYEDYVLNVLEDNYDSANTESYFNLHGLTTSQYIVCGFTERQAGIRFNIAGGTKNITANSLASVSYWNGSTWASVGDIEDETSDSGKSFAQSGVISWDAPADGVEFQTEFTGKVHSTSETTETPMLYYYKISFDKNLSGLSNKIHLVQVTGIPAQKRVSGYKFPLNAMNRLWLFSDQFGQKNKTICSAESTSNVFNGDDSIEMTWGDEGELMGAAWLYSQYGASIYSILVVFKKNEMWALIGNDPSDWRRYKISSSIGCVAPETIRVVELPSEGSQAVNRSSVIIFQGANGVYMTDGRPPIKITGDIDDVFDKRQSKISQTYIDRSFGFIDKENHEYHWCYGETLENDSEKVFDYAKMKWFDIDRPYPLKTGIEVEDVNGTTYTYGIIDEGYMLRLENGNSFDGTAIEHVMHLGDIALHGDGVVSIETIAEYHTLIAKAKTTSSNITMTHYGDTQITGTDLTVSPVRSGFRAIADVTHETFGGYIFHSWKFTISTDDESVGFEPLFFVCLYKTKRDYTKDYRGQ